MVKVHQSSENLDSTEQRIYTAAVDVFLEKGYDGARMQEIADRAGINKALLHYYYRSKEQLFKRVFADTVSAMFENISMVFTAQLPFEEKLRRFSEAYISFLIQRPGLPLFLLTEIRLHPQLIENTMNDLKLKSRFTMMKLLIHEAIEKDEIETGSALHLMIHIVSMLIFPIVGKSMIMMLLDLTNEQYAAIIEERKSVVPEFVLKTVKKS